MRSSSARASPLILLSSTVPALTSRRPPGPPFPDGGPLVGGFYAKCERCGVRLGRPGRGRQVLVEDFARGPVAEAAPRGAVEPVGEPRRGADASAPGSASRGRKRLTRPFAFSTPPFCQGECGSQK